MRPILFRAKSTDVYSEGKWLYGYLTKSSGVEENLSIKQEGYLPIPIDVKTVGQFTGLVDKKDNRIYEYDIIKVPSVMDENAQLYELYIVIFYGGAFMVTPNSFDMSDEFLQCIYDEAEIIGNVFDNKELVNSEKLEIIFQIFNVRRNAMMTVRC